MGDLRKIAKEVRGQTVDPYESIALLEEAQVALNEGIEKIRQAMAGTDYESHAEAYILPHLEEWANSPDSPDYTIPRYIEVMKSGEPF